MKPYEVFCKIIYEYVALFANKLGMNFTDPQYKPSLKTVFPIASMLIFSVIEVNTCCTDEVGVCLQSILMILIAAQVIKYSMINRFVKIIELCL